MKTTIL